MGCAGCATGSARAGGCASGRCGTGGCPSMHAFDWLPDLGTAAPPASFDVVEVSFKGGRRGFFANRVGLDIHTGDEVIVEADRGVDFGTVHLAGEMVRLRLRSKGIPEDEAFPAITRRATLEDIERYRAMHELDAETFLVGRRTIDRMSLPMKLVDVEWQFDERKVTFFFTSEQRVDFRELVRRLAKRYRTRVELRQIGARDEAARIGGIGSCGRTLCCSTWLQEFRPVSTQAAKTQNLPLNPVRLSGQCGRLKCCLNYELDQYMDALRRFPRADSPVHTPKGIGIVQKLDIFRDTVGLAYEDGSWEERPLAEVRALLGWGD